MKPQLVSHVQKDILICTAKVMPNYHLLLSATFELLHLTPPLILIKNFHLKYQEQSMNPRKWQAQYLLVAILPCNHYPDYAKVSQRRDTSSVQREVE